MLNSDDDAPQKPAPISLPRALDKLSVEELDAYIHVLEEERRRVKAEIVKKQAARTGADAIFGG